MILMTDLVSFTESEDGTENCWSGNHIVFKSAVHIPAAMSQHTFTIGICATDDVAGMERLLGRLCAEPLPDGCEISDAVIVVSGSTDGTDAVVAKFSLAHPCTLIVERERKGKAEAVNRIMDSMKGRHLILVNGDALPERGSLSHMMLSLLEGGNAVVCGVPFPAESECGALVGRASCFLWELHNTTMETMQSKGEKIHLTDEMIGLNAPAIVPLPEGTINDGAYIAARAQQYGQSVAFCRSARVAVSVATTFRGLMRQRRRILFGHMRVKEMTGSAPGTVEFSFLRSPLLCLGIIARTLRIRPDWLLLLPWMGAMEAAALFCALRDMRARRDSYTVWTRIENASWR